MNEKIKEAIEKVAGLPIDLAIEVEACCKSFDVATVKDYVEHEGMDSKFQHMTDEQSEGLSVLLDEEVFKVVSVEKENITWHVQEVGNYKHVLLYESSSETIAYLVLMKVKINFKRY